jgi:hypothetical protein
VRTTLNLDDDLLTQAKALAQQSGKTLTRVVEDALRERLARRARPAPDDVGFHLHTFTGSGLRPGVDLDNSAALRDVMDDLA